VAHIVGGAREEDRKMVESSLRLMEAINREISVTNDMIEEMYKNDKDATAGRGGKLGGETVHEVGGETPLRVFGSSTEQAR